MRFPPNTGLPSDPRELADLLDAVLATIPPHTGRGRPGRLAAAARHLRLSVRTIRRYAARVRAAGVRPEGWPQ